MTSPADVLPYRSPGPEQETDEWREVLETRFQEQTDRLIELTGRYRFSGDDAVAASIASARLSLAETAHALRRLAEDRIAEDHITEDRISEGQGWYQPM